MRSRRSANATVETRPEHEPDEGIKEAHDDLYPRGRALNDHILEAAERGLAPNRRRSAGA